MNEKEEKVEKSEIVKKEEAILDFWAQNQIFEKSLKKENSKGEFVFYEGPPGANGVPMLHHFEARAFKDVIPRYKTMQGYHVDRRAGWDCHGLPVELQSEKELGLKSKKEIEEYGIAKYNDYCRATVVRYVKEWEVFTDRMGYWVDNDRAYYTMDNNFIESGWNIVAHAHKNNLLIKDYKILPWCARCGTGLSSHELGQPGVYVDVKDLTVIAKFKIIGFPDAYFLAWTTTPWTLPGNVALAVGADIDYVEIKVSVKAPSLGGGVGEGLYEIYVLAKERLEVITTEYEIIAEHKGAEMAGMKYEPLYNVDKNKNENIHQVYVGNFVNTESGTGIVHIAPMYGADDFELGTKNNLPKVHTVNPEGNFVAGVDFLEGRFVKDEEVAIDIIKDLAHRGLLYKKEKYEHNYPHCWRCKTPLIYYARDSWYFAMSKLRDKMLDLNNGINWEPAHLKEGRFGEWLREIKDWAISRERYWGTPLPVWQNKDGDLTVISGLEMLKNKTKKSGNKYFVMRHGQASHNLGGLISDEENAPDHLTDLGIEQVKNSAQNLKDKKIDLIIASPFVRTKETTEIVGEVIGIEKGNIILDDRLREFKVGNSKFKTWADYHDAMPKTVENFSAALSGGESYLDVKKRVMDLMYELENKYQDKNILLVTHGGPSWLLVAGSDGYTSEQALNMIRNKKDFHYLDNSGIHELDFVPLPHNANYELDLHKPYIDEVKLVDDSGEELVRVKEVMDVWFDSGAMPYAQDHYPFENKEWIEKGGGYPADFISEAIDQTRGWFYTLVAVSALYDKGTPYKNVICLGHLLDKDGVKMSKSKGNVIDSWEQMNKYGADTVRMWMYSVTAPGDSKNYDEKVVKELQNKIFGLLNNILAFYELYRDRSLEGSIAPSLGGGVGEGLNVLDTWIFAKLNNFINLVTDGLDNYKIFEPARGFRDFIDDLSTWYLRRSRERLKDGDTDAKKTLYYVLKTLAKVMAPFAPFTAEDVWQKLKVERDVESVHLASFPLGRTGGGAESDLEEAILENMKVVRELVTLGLEARQKAGIKVRQPLRQLTINNEQLTNEYLEILKDELNVKEIVVAGKRTDLKNLERSVLEEAKVELDTTITPELKQGGDYRELLRGVQDMRKANGLLASDMINLKVETNEVGKEIIEKFLSEFKKTAGLTEIKFTSNDGTEIKVDDLVFKVEVEK